MVGTTNHHIVEMLHKYMRLYFKVIFTKIWHVPRVYVENNISNQNQNQIMNHTKETDIQNLLETSDCQRKKFVSENLLVKYVHI